ncbi:hypothetical protein T484DRAFT_1823858 [Baffinella frigidus]|nr:hypothetical protein T484DRAFT_1823858 [Cryptophyta sp. CCMP2293]
MFAGWTPSLLAPLLLVALSISENPPPPVSSFLPSSVGCALLQSRHPAACSLSPLTSPGRDVFLAPSARQPAPGARSSGLVMLAKAKAKVKTGRVADNKEARFQYEVHHQPPEVNQIRVFERFGPTVET